MNYAFKVLKEELDKLKFEEKSIILCLENFKTDRKKLINELKDNVKKQEYIIIAMTLLYKEEWGEEL